MNNKEKINGFYGGIHPEANDNKEISLGKKIVNYIPEILEVSMEQSYNNISRLIVQEGEQVKKEQLIGEPDDKISSYIYSGIPGEVIDIKRKKNKAGREFEICVIKRNSKIPDKEESKNKYYCQNIKIPELDREYIIQEIKTAGITGMGGAGFPAWIKYSTELKIDTLLINGAECEPYLTCDDSLMIDEGTKVLNGILLLKKAAGSPRCIIGIEENKKLSIDNMDKLIKKYNIGNLVEIYVLPEKYPQGGERQLIQTILKREVPMGRLPSHIGVIVSNVATAAAAADAVYGEIPLTSRIVTVTGIVKKPVNYKVPIGTRFQELISASGGVMLPDNKVIEGGPMTGRSIGRYDEKKGIEGSVKKTTSGLLVLKNKNIVETRCIRCGECAKICPARINPFKIDFAYLHENIDLCSKLYATECISCGSCSYICPAKRNLAYRVTMAKNEVKRRG